MVLIYDILMIAIEDYVKDSAIPVDVRNKNDGLGLAVWTWDRLENFHPDKRGKVMDQFRSSTNDLFLPKGREESDVTTTHCDVFMKAIYQL